MLNCFQLNFIIKTFWHQKRWINTAKRRVVISGLGIVSPLGVGVNQTWSALLASASGVVNVDSSKFKGIPCQVAAYVPTHELKLDEKFSASDLRTMSMASVYSLIAGEEALNNAQWSTWSQKDKERTGVAIGSGMCHLQDIYDHLSLFQCKGYNKFSPHFITKVLLNMPAGYLSIKFGLKGPNHSVTTACTTGLHAIGDGFNFIQRDAADIMVCGGSEAVICPASLAAFSRIRALCCDFNDAPTKASRPFDEKRSGFVMGEGAGLVVLEELNHALNRKANIIAEVLGYGLSGDAHHITAPPEDGNGAFRCMKAALDDAALTKKDILQINCHATSTPLGDKAELKAIKDLFESHASNIYITSTKGATGHLLGAAGLGEGNF